jgi:hypothetical protein
LAKFQSPRAINRPKIIGTEQNVYLICNLSLYTHIPNIKSISQSIVEKKWWQLFYFGIMEWRTWVTLYVPAGTYKIILVHNISWNIYTKGGTGKFYVGLTEIFILPVLWLTENFEYIRQNILTYIKEYIGFLIVNLPWKWYSPHKLTDQNIQ